MRAGGLVLAGVLTVAACGGGDDSMSSESLDAAAATVAPAAASPGDQIAIGGEPATGDQAEAPADFDYGIVGRDVIIEMHVVLSSDDIQRSVASIMATASSLGGGVASSDVDYGDQTGNDRNDGYAVLVVRVPPTAVDRLLSGLDATGTVQSITQSAQDVTEQLVDLDVRISNARRSVATVRDFMDRTQNLSELVTLEGELTRRQTELERLEAQQRNLSERVALSTITIEVVPTASVPEPVDESSDTITDALQRGWDAFAAFLFGIAFILAVLLPFIGLAALAAALVWLALRRRGRRASRPGTPADVPDNDHGSTSPFDPPGAADDMPSGTHGDAVGGLAAAHEHTDAPAPAVSVDEPEPASPTG
jgi:hypothetical protein